MFFLQRPLSGQIDTILEAQAQMDFAYPGVGATRSMYWEEQGSPNGGPEHNAPAGYLVDHNRVRLGSGQACFERAKDAIQQWQMFKLGWVEICWHSTIKTYPPIQVGTTVGVMASLPFWSLNPCRIVYTVDEVGGGIHRSGFGYGTLPRHAERGEESFQVEWHRADDSVWYDIVAFSQPNHLLAKIGYPVARLLQKRFARDSKQAMVKANRHQAKHRKPRRCHSERAPGD